MDEVNVEAVDVRLELVEAVELPLLFAPVVIVPPVRHQLAHVGQVGAVRPVRAFELVREAGVRQPRLQILEHGIRHVDRERHDGVGAGVHPGAGVAGGGRVAATAARGAGQHQEDQQPHPHVNLPSGAG